MNFPLKKSIIDTGVKQYRLAQDIGIKPVRFSKIVYEHVEPSLDERRRIAKALGRKETELFKGPTYNFPPTYSYRPPNLETRGGRKDEDDD